MPFAPIEKMRSQWRELPQESRFSVGVLSLAGIAILGFSFAYLKQSVTQPFMVPIAKVKQATEQITELERSNNQNLELRKKDTDRDGLSDYAELNIYNTSPYLADTDSDSFTDALEIAQGQNPNCAKGQVCNTSLNAGRGTTSTNDDLLQEDNPVEDFILNAPYPSTISTEKKKQQLLQTGYVTPEEIKELPASQIDFIYKEAYDEIQKLREQYTQLRSSSTATSTATSTAP